MTVPAIGQELGVSEKMVRVWLSRFAQDGVAGLEDAPRSGRPRTYSEDRSSRTSLAGSLRSREDCRPNPPRGNSRPRATGHWTGCRKNWPRGVPIKRSQIRRILKAEHIKWQKPRTWLESDDPEFAENRVPLSGSTPLHQRAAR